MLLIDLLNFKHFLNVGGNWPCVRKCRPCVRKDTVSVFQHKATQFPTQEHSISTQGNTRRKRKVLKYNGIKKFQHKKGQKRPKKKGGVYFGRITARKNGAKNAEPRPAKESAKIPIEA